MIGNMGPTYFTRYDAEGNPKQFAGPGMPDGYFRRPPEQKAADPVLTEVAKTENNAADSVPNETEPEEAPVTESER